MIRMVSNFRAVGDSIRKQEAGWLPDLQMNDLSVNTDLLLHEVIPDSGFVWVNLESTNALRREVLPILSSDRSTQSPRA